MLYIERAREKQRKRGGGALCPLCMLYIERAREKQRKRGGGEGEGGSERGRRGVREGGEGARPHSYMGNTNIDITGGGQNGI